MGQKQSFSVIRRNVRFRGQSRLQFEWRVQRDDEYFGLGASGPDLIDEWGTQAGRIASSNILAGACDYAIVAQGMVA